VPHLKPTALLTMPTHCTYVRTTSGRCWPSLSVASRCWHTLSSSSSDRQGAIAPVGMGCVWCVHAHAHVCLWLFGPGGSHSHTSTAVCCRTSRTTPPHNASHRCSAARACGCPPWCRPALAARRR
jgi:hypothetical protein